MGDDLREPKNVRAEPAARSRAGGLTLVNLREARDSPSLLAREVTIPAMDARLAGATLGTDVPVRRTGIRLIRSRAAMIGVSLGVTVVACVDRGELQQVCP